MDHFSYLCLMFGMLFCLSIAALWSPEGKGPTSWLLFVTFIIPPQTLFVVGILFSRCPCVRASVRPSVRNVLFF